VRCAPPPAPPQQRHEPAPAPHAPQRQARSPACRGRRGARGVTVAGQRLGIEWKHRSQGKLPELSEALGCTV
jgi:hypothetical protein